MNQNHPTVAFYAFSTVAEAAGKERRPFGVRRTPSQNDFPGTAGSTGFTEGES
jgi:hypothetical protein